MRDNKNLTVGMLLAAICIMAVGYAALAQQLQIRGTIEIDGSWDIHLENLTNTNKTATTTVLNTTSIEEGNVSANIDVEFLQPGDNATFTIDIVNAGTIDAKLNGLTVTPQTESDGEDVTEEITWTVSGIAVNDVIPATSGSNTKTVTVYVEYPKTAGEQTIATNKTRGLTVYFDFIQN